MPKLITALQAIFIITVCLVALMCEQEPPREDQCSKWDSRCNAEHWEWWSVCNDEGQWVTIDISPGLCVDGEDRWVCSVGCEFGKSLIYGSQLWECKEGPDCQDKYYQRGEK